MDLQSRLELTGSHLLNALLPDWHYLPYWSIRIDRQYMASVRRWWPAHNIGRWWDALLRLLEATGFEIPADLEAAMLANTQRFFDNPDHLCLAPLNMQGVEPFFELHSLREGLLALHALVRYRGSSWARRKAHRTLETIWRASREDGNWDLDKFSYPRCGSGSVKVLECHMDPTGSHGRLMEALVWFYQATGDGLALDLVERFARYHLEYSTSPDGELNRASNPDHTHSYFGTLRGLLLFGALTNQQVYIERVARTYQVTVSRPVRDSGFTAHDLESEGFGETTSPGDAAQIALWLSRHGYTQLLDDTERIVRARLLPGQIVESPLVQPSESETVGADRLNEMVIGGLGGCHAQPHAGKGCVTDVSAAGLHTLVDIYNHILMETPLGLTVNFHFDFEDHRAKVQSSRDRQASVLIEPKVPGPVVVRLPAWAPKASVQVLVDGQAVQPLRLGCFAQIRQAAPMAKIELRYELPQSVSRERIQDMEYEIYWRGDEIVGIVPHDDFYPFYPAHGGIH